MKKVERSVLTTIAVIGGVLTLAGTQPAQAKSYAKVTKYGYNYVESSNLLAFTGKYGLYTKPGTTKGAKLVKNKRQLLALNANKHGQKTFMFLRQATTNRGSVYYKVGTFDHRIKGWIYAGKKTQKRYGFIYYKHNRNKSAGGVKMTTTMTDSALTATEKTHFYRLTTPGTKNDGTSLFYSSPFWTTFDGQTKPNQKSSLAYRNDVFLIDYAKTRNREGDRWVAATDVNNKNVSGYIKASGMTAIQADDIKASVTVNYVDSDTKKQVGSLIIPVLGNQKTINIARINDFQAPKGYTSDNDSMAGQTFGFPIKGSTGYSYGIDNVKVGGHVNYYVHN